MSREQERAASRERECAAVFGTKRVVRKAKYEKASDVVPFEVKWTSPGFKHEMIVQPEVKSGMKRLPRTLVTALEQAQRYCPDGLPVAVFSDVGGHAVACLDMKVLASLMGVLPERFEKKPGLRKRKKRSMKQLGLFEPGVDS